MAGTIHIFSCRYVTEKELKKLSKKLSTNELKSLMTKVCCIKIMANFYYLMKVADETSCLLKLLQTLPELWSFVKLLK